MLKRISFSSGGYLGSSLVRGIFLLRASLLEKTKKRVKTFLRFFPLGFSLESYSWEQNLLFLRARSDGAASRGHAKKNVLEHVPALSLLKRARSRSERTLFCNGIRTVGRERDPAGAAFPVDSDVGLSVRWRRIKGFRAAAFFLRIFS